METMNIVYGNLKLQQQQMLQRKLENKNVTIALIVLIHSNATIYLFCVELQYYTWNQFELLSTIQCFTF